MIFKNKFNEVRSGWKILLVFLLTFGIIFACSSIMGIILGIIILNNGNIDQFMNMNLDSIENNELVINPDYEEQKQARERERVSHLKCTKRVFVLMLEQLGIDYFEQVQPKIEANRQARLEWELCVELERSNPLLNLIGGELGITPEQIDNLFKYANGEITENEFLGV